MESRAKVFRIVWRTGELLHHPLQRVFLAFYIRRDYVLPSRMRRGHNLIRKLALLPPILTQRASIGSNINLEGECCCRPKSKPTTTPSLSLSKPPPPLPPPRAVHAHLLLFKTCVQWCPPIINGAQGYGCNGASDFRGPSLYRSTREGQA